MVREWYHRSRSSSMRRVESRQSPGCMAHVLHLFDLHTKQEQQQQQQQPSQDSVLLQPIIFLKGLEAPGNSLELEERSSAMAPPSCSSSSSAAMKDDDDYIPFSVQLPPLRPSTPLERDPSSEPCKTPGVVARLMGLELLPPETRRSSATSSPVFRRPSARRPKVSSSSTSRHESGTRSLPDTPRISSARRSVDVDHRLSLHLNKENVGATPEFDYRVFPGDPSWNYSSPPPLVPRRAARKRESRLKSCNDDNPSPRRHVVETVGRRVVGADITNMISTNSRTRNGGDGEKQSPPPVSHLKKARRSARPSEEAVVQSKHTILPNPSSPSSPSLSSLSPRMRVQEMAKNRITVAAEDRSLKPLRSPPLKSAKELSCNKLNKSSPRPPPKPAAAIIKCRKASCERFTSKPRRATSPSDSSIPCLPHDVLTKNKKWQVLQRKRVVPSREDPPGLLLSASSSDPGLGLGLPYNAGPTAGRLAARDDHTVSAEFQYLRAILQLVGIQARGPVTASFARWYSPAHPLDPAIFHALERSPPAVGSLGLSPDRRLIFHLADEVLAVLLRPHLHLKPWLPSIRMHAYAPPPTGAQLLDRVWTWFRSFPRANCQTLQDIDELVGSDLPEEAHEEEWEAVVGEIERRILDSLVDEAAAGLCWSRSASD